MPDINPDWSAPGLVLVQQIASWVLAISLIIAFIAFIACFIGVVSKGFGVAQVQKAAGSGIMWAFLGTVVLASLSGVFHFVIGLDLGL